ncbi:MAG: hypothetical protein KVP17_002601 [Porospora cf. gigantea B]|uniref:uncharacterized protein n=2 Tax=Porospora cf. gigantea B TaxID=2853592 RepID=UPI003571BD85|nr:MAG: hypothetical protein KVP17_002601 [Porospora cf. gigantea B]
MRCACTAHDDLHIEAPSGRPKDSLRFEPSEGDIESSGGRYIFLNVNYPPSAAAKIRSVLENDQVKGLPKKSKLEIPRILFAFHMKTEEVIQWIIKHASLRGKLFPLCDCTPTLRQNLKLGALYWHGYDRNYRPLLVVNLKRLKPIESNNEQLVELFVFNFEYFIQHLQVAGRVENWKILIDCEGRSIMDLAPETISTMMRVLGALYRGRLAQMVVCNFPWWLSIVSSFVMGFMPPASVAKVAFTPNNVQNTLRSSFDEAQLEEKYGGSLSDLAPGDCYPYRVTGEVVTQVDAEVVEGHILLD